MACATRPGWAGSAGPANTHYMSPATLAGCGALILWAFLALLSRLAAGIPPLQLTAMGFAVGGTIGLLVVLARGQAGRLAQPPEQRSRKQPGLPARVC